MLYHKYIEVDNLEVIQKKTVDFFYKNWIHTRIGLYRIPWEDFNNECPEFKTCLSRYGLTPLIAYSIIFHNQSESITHIDWINPNKVQARINLPILNCENTTTEFYEGDVNQFDYHFTPDKTVEYYRIKEGEVLKKVDEVEVIKPTVMRVQVPHRVMINEKAVPRITLSIVCNKDPIYMLED